MPIAEMSDKDDRSKLNKPTEIFDNCGVFDKNTKDTPAITRPSGDENFTDALTFLEWYGVKLLPNFGFILVDTLAEEGKDWKDNYSNLRSLLKDNKMLGDSLTEE